MTGRPRLMAARSLVVGSGAVMLASLLTTPAQAAGATSTATKARTVTGTSVSTPFGPVQVSVRVVAGKVTKVTPIAYPRSDPRSAQINAYAIPVLQKQALAAQSASIAGVSGASYSSNAFAQSLQSALTKAGL